MIIIKSHLKKALCLIVLISISTIGLAQDFNQLFRTKTGKYGTIKLETKKMHENVFELVINVNWVDKDLKSVKDDQSYIVLNKSDIEISSPNTVQCETFKTRNTLSIQKSGSLHFLVNNNFNANDIKIKMNFGYAKNVTATENPEKFMFSQPAKLMATKTIDKRNLIVIDKKGPEIIVTNPDFSWDSEQIAEENPIKVIGKVNDNSEIKSFVINGNEISLDADRGFEYSFKLQHGSNTLAIKAVDVKGNSTTKDFYIKYNDPEWYSFEDNSEPTNVETSGKYYALIIGVDDYIHDGISDLDKPIADGKALKDVLVSKYTFDEENIFFLENPKREDIIVKLDELSYDLTSEDNLIIFYAGHGYWDETKELGYWLPADSKYSNTANWLRNSTLRDYIKAINTNHTLLIADACFSGGIFKTRSAFSDASKGINRLYSMKSRKAMTSGTLKEVPDKSVFLQFLLKRLKDNKKKYVASEQLFFSFKEAVMNNSENVPQFGTIQNANDEGGDFIFIQRQ